MDYLWQFPRTGLDKALAVLGVWTGDEVPPVVTSGVPAGSQ
jgi:hypothetical protein